MKIDAREHIQGFQCHLYNCLNCSYYSEVQGIIIFQVHKHIQMTNDEPQVLIMYQEENVDI